MYQYKAQEEEPEKEVVITKAIPEDIKGSHINLEKSLFLLSIPVLLRLCSESVIPAFIDGDIMYLVCPTNGHLVVLTKHIDEIVESITKFYSKEFNIKSYT